MKNKVENILFRINALISEKKNHSFEEFSNEVEVSRQTLRLQLNGQSKLPLNTFLKIAEVLEVDPCHLIGYNDNAAIKIKNVKASENSSINTVIGNGQSINVNHGKTENYSNILKKTELLEAELKVRRKDCVQKDQLIDFLNEKIRRLEG